MIALEENEIKFPVGVHFLSAILAVIVAAVIVVILNPQSGYSVALIFVGSALGVPMIPVLIWLVK